MSVDRSGEITAIATAVLAAFAIVTAIVAYMAFRKQAAEHTAISASASARESTSARYR